MGQREIDELRAEIRELRAMIRQRPIINKSVLAPGGGLSHTTSEDFGPLSTSWTVPAGVNRVMCVLIGGGGGGGGCDGTAGSMGYIATTSGGSPTRLLQARLNGGGGGAGALTIVEFNVTPGGSVNFTVGTGGSGGTTAPTSGTSGTVTSVTTPGGTLIQADAGGLGYSNTGTFPGRGGRGGRMISIAPALGDNVVTLLMAGGEPGRSGVVDISGSGGAAAVIYSPGRASENGIGWFPNDYGRGGSGGGGLQAGTAGTNGRIYFIY